MSETMTMAKALNAGLRRALEADPKVVLAGEDIGQLGGVFRITEHLQRDFGPERVIDSPLAESGIVGTALGMALRGYRPVVEIQFDGFVYPAFDQIVSQVSRMRFRSMGRLGVPMVVRIPYGGAIGAIEHHSESPEAYFAHTPGLVVATPSTPLDAYWMIQQAVASDDPVVFLEPKRRYHEKGEVDLTEPPLAFDAARVVLEGTDATLISYGPMVKTCVEAALAASTEGRSLEVIDLRSVSPLDDATIRASVEKTGRAIVVHEAIRSGGIGGEIAARLQEWCFYSLEAPVLRVTGYDLPYPPSRVEKNYLPDLDRILDAVDRSMAD
ncbi:alpha-ketoacid dehydrogenase subunit beta [Propioniciclava coleopterorum]|uniref:Alpha-ketoacid dehydrogenase subunit beta n=1 Tax=Propioniciclava coleopterorum TaxID=2714937 RepID=A0A6G7Y6H9_9ACTN|nr:alpha-ketoacid dehydrogenase subunit beta [Propioniciclava coleopterorum]QIK72422.1 alpha-ketoacid dehydrogenase subunit beta [Propioniciclava coleopterorum]